MLTVHLQIRLHLVQLLQSETQTKRKQDQNGMDPAKIYIIYTNFEGRNTQCHKLKNYTYEGKYDKFYNVNCQTNFTSVLMYDDLFSCLIWKHYF